MAANQYRSLSKNPYMLEKWVRKVNDAQIVKKVYKAFRYYEKNNVELPEMVLWNIAPILRFESAVLDKTEDLTIPKSFLYKTS